MERKFNFNWFDGQIYLFSKLLEEFKGKEVKFLEIGSFEGNSTCWCLDNILTHPSSTITCVDSWQGGFEHSNLNMSDIERLFLSNIESRKSSVEIVKGLSREALIFLQDRRGYYDFIYIDGGHTLKDVITDAILAFDLLKPGGIMAFDDYPWGSDQLAIDIRPQLGIDCFLIGWNKEFDIIHKDYQVWIRRKAQ